MNKNSVVIENYINEKLLSYKRFMDIEKVPQFELIINQEETVQTDIAVIAAHNYNVKTDTHTLTITKDITLGEKDHILFHEFTHMYDVITYSEKNSLLYFSNRGYTEYHASQIELLKLLGAESTFEKLSFSLNDHIKTIFGETTILDYILTCKNGVRNLITDAKFPDTLNTFISALGMIFNHLGRISICRMYANDYDLFKDDLEELTVEKSFLGQYSTQIISVAEGFFTKNQIVQLGLLFSQMAQELFNKYEKSF
ncbi:hypothetical protein AM499_02750 [Bacillus sp. FJAT-22090]|uniref:hypothetical protein n=1 Tax=Bacillus sp. FJAT-22090 TaxID=1581038 RepID=UPI0006AFE175|nr:hypothetical protein [Bacillus sp. FJAT-22090]ALC84851.1 hypothetical protein AM499_02750 [Bacillus sp. FJAT-22090]